MYGNIKWLRFVPDQPGRGGWKTGIHSFQQQPINDVRTLLNAHVYRGAWRRDFDPVLYPNPQSLDVSSFPIARTIHGYVYPSLTDPSAQPSVTILSQHDGAPLSTTIWDFAGSLRQSRPFTAQLGTWQNINGRCFYGDGGTQALIMDDRTPAIHAQKNQNLGIDTPTQPMPNSLGGNVTQYGTGYTYGTFPVGISPYINHPDPNNPIGTIVATDTLTVSKIDPNYAIYTGAVIAAGSPTVAAVTSNTTPFAATGTISCTTGTSIVRLTGATWPANAQYAGLALNFNGFSFVILGTGTGAATIADVNGNTAVLANTDAYLLGVYDGPTVTNIPYTITGSQVTMPANGTLGVANSSAVAVPPGLAFGYSQSTLSGLVQVKISAARAGGYFRNLGNISLGPESATQTTGGAISTITDGFMPDNKKVLTSASNLFDAGMVGQAIAVDGASATGGTLKTTVGAFVNTGSILLALPNVSGGAIGPVNAWWGAGPVISDGDMAIGSATLTSASNPFVSGDVGQVIVVDRAGAAGALITTIAAFVGAGNVTLAAPNVSGVHITGADVWWRGISVLTHSGPTYAYAWYDPETGHMSNVSPLYQVPRPTNIGNFTDFANITPTFQIDPGYISYPTQATDGIRFSHIMFFRTLSTPGASTLYPIGSLNPFIGKVHPGSASTRGSWNPGTYHGWIGIPNNYTDAPPAGAAPNYWYDWSTDNDLLLSGGFRAPQFTNEKPKVLLRGGATQTGFPYAMSYWDRRLWIANTQAPGEIAFSCDEAQCPLGLPEESFPPTNLLQLPSVDGRVIGMRTVGDMLLITTERWAYIVAGNNESNYRLLKVSASMPGVGTYQMDEFPTYSGAEGEPTTLFYLGRDRKVYQWTFGSNVVPISGPIQDQLDTYLQAGTPLVTYQGSLVHCVSAWGRRLVVVAPYVQAGTPATQGYPTFIYDVDNQVWSQSTRGDGTQGGIYATNSPMTTVYGLNIPVNEIYSVVQPANGRIGVRSWIRDDAPNANTGTMTIITFPTTFDGKKIRKRLVGVNVHADAGQYSLTTTVNEGPPQAILFATYPDPLNSIYGAGATPVDGNLQDLVVLQGQLSAATAPLIGYRFTIEVQRSDALPAKIYAIDIAYQDAEEQGEGDP